MLRNIILTTLAAAVCFAQPAGRRGGAASFDEVKAYLGLSDTQVQSITASNKAAREANSPLMEQIRTKQKALRAAMAADANDAAAVGAAMIEIKTLHKQAAAARTKTHEQAVSFLSAEQKAKLATLGNSRDLRRETMQAQRLQLLAPSAKAGRMGPGHGPRRMARPNA